MTAEKLLGFVRAVPFRPFTIYLGDGRSLVVPHPEILLVSKDLELATWHGPDEETEGFALDEVLKVVRKPAKRRPQ